MLDNAKLYSSTMTELGSLLKRLCEDAAGIIGTEASSIFLREDNHFVMRAAYGYSAPLVDKAIYAPGEGLTGWIGLGNRFIANSPEEVRQHPSWLGKYDTQTQQQRKTINTFRGLIAVPLLSEKTIIGLIKVENKISGPFTDEDVTRLGIYARNATAFIETKKEAIAVMKGMYIFVLMPFADEFNDIYKFGIKQCIDQMGMKCERVDKRHFTRGILQEIYRCIERANYIVADITGKNRCSSSSKKTLMRDFLGLI